MARKKRPGPRPEKTTAPRRATSADFRFDRDNPDPSPLEFIDRRMDEEDREEPES